ncbi:hypothetical protein ACFQ34_33505 [Pseudonocardia benzenivorans]|uniref:Lipoprotein n=1 Tax=Pseudonocardia benzenivorans TaxID=228005 RepID=A0ABW3VUX6_9PSEU
MAPQARAVYAGAVTALVAILAAAVTTLSACRPPHLPAPTKAAPTGPVPTAGPLP